MKNNNPYAYAEGQVVKIKTAQSRQIRKFYNDFHNEIKKEIKKMEKSDSYSLQRHSYLLGLEKEIQTSLNSIGSNSEKLISYNVSDTVGIMTQVNETFLHGIGFQDYITAPGLKQNIANRIITGQIYNGKTSLSKAIWGDNNQKQQEIRNTIARGFLKGESNVEIAKKLEGFLNPKAPGSVDYNTQRLAKTMVQHAYQEAFVELTKNNPFIDAYRWITSGGHNVCQLCIEREETDEFGLGEGIFPKDQLPLDHPNGNCTWEIVSSFSDEEVADYINDWYFDEGDEEMNEKIDFFLKDLERNF